MLNHRCVSWLCIVCCVVQLSKGQQGVSSSAPLCFQSYFTQVMSVLLCLECLSWGRVMLMCSVSVRVSKDTDHNNQDGWKVLGLAGWTLFDTSTEHLFPQARNYIQSLSYMPKMNFENVFIGANPLGKSCSLNLPETEGSMPWDTEIPKALLWLQEECRTGLCLWRTCVPGV